MFQKTCTLLKKTIKELLMCINQESGKTCEERVKASSKRKIDTRGGYKDECDTKNNPQNIFYGVESKRRLRHLPAMNRVIELNYLFLKNLA